MWCDTLLLTNWYLFRFYVRRYTPLFCTSSETKFRCKKNVFLNGNFVLNDVQNRADSNEVWVKLTYHCFFVLLSHLGTWEFYTNITKTYSLLWVTYIYYDYEYFYTRKVEHTIRVKTAHTLSYIDRPCAFCDTHLCQTRDAPSIHKLLFCSPQARTMEINQSWVKTEINLKIVTWNS